MSSLKEECIRQWNTLPESKAKCFAAGQVWLDRQSLDDSDAWGDHPWKYTEVIIVKRTSKTIVFKVHANGGPKRKKIDTDEDGAECVHDYQLYCTKNMKLTSDKGITLETPLEKNTIKRVARPPPIAVSVAHPAIGRKRPRDIVTELKELKQMKDNGDLTPEEFIAAKKKVLQE